MTARLAVLTFAIGCTATVVALIFTGPGPATSIAIMSTLITLSAFGSIPKR